MIFHPGELEIQRRAGVREMADEVAEGIGDFVSGPAGEFLRRRPFVVLGTIDAGGRAWVSVVAGAPGFVQVVDARTLRLDALASAGDPLLENLAHEARVAMLAIDFFNPRRVRVNGRGIIEGGAIHIRTEQVYGNCRRYIQERMLTGPRQTAASPAPAPARSDALSAAGREQILLADTFFIATSHPQSGNDVSHKGGDPGFVRVVDARRLWFPDYNGNRMFNTLGNLSINPRVGLLFIDFNSGRTLQLTGRGSIDWNPQRGQTVAGAERIVDFEIDQVIDNAAGFPLLTKFRQFSRFNPKP